MKIGELAHKTGLAPSAIRFYEQSGLLPAPERRANGYRVYTEGALKQLQRIQVAQNLGFSLVSLRSAFAAGEFLSKDDLMVRLDGRVREIDQLIASLRAQRQDLTDMRTALRKAPADGECTEPRVLAARTATTGNKAAHPPRQRKK